MIEIDLNIKHCFSEKFYAKQMTLPKAHYAEAHKHKYSHLSLLHSGKVKLTCNGVETIYEGPALIEVPAGAEHHIEAIENTIWYCLHQTDEKNIDLIDKVLIKENT